jgi:Ser/Thr protein kinase RdoA (MazF antagonist)
MPGDFDFLTPEKAIDAVEEALGVRLGGYASALPSYVNRVFELESFADRTRVVAKFYRPGRWTPEAIAEEHEFVLECAHDEIPVVAPLKLTNNSTVATSQDGILFAVYPKRSGRLAEFESQESLKRVGSLASRIHAAGLRHQAPERTGMRPCVFGMDALDRLQDSGQANGPWAEEFLDTAFDAMKLSEELFPDDDAFIRVHGDFHAANVLERPGEGLMAIDFDDMAIGPAVQDLWLLLPGRPDECPAETDALLDGYCQFMDFDHFSLRLVEPLRAMRMLHFLAWCSLQRGDRNFHDKFPDWGSDSFWRRESADMRKQIELIDSAR